MGNAAVKAAAVDPARLAEAAVGQLEVNYEPNRCALCTTHDLATS